MPKTTARPTATAQRATISRCPDFLYAWSPSDTAADTRWAFQLATCLSLREAYDYAIAFPTRRAELTSRGHDVDAMRAEREAEIAKGWRS